MTRSNLRGLTCHHGKDWVKNGDTWEVTRHHTDGSLTVRNLHHDGALRLPADYVTDRVDLAYASTAHRVQGSTVDTAHALVTEEMTRESLYVASTRGRTHTTWYTTTEQLLEASSDREPDPPLTAREVLTGVLQRQGAEASATSTIRSTLNDATTLPTLVARFTHARNLAAVATLRDAAKGALPERLADHILANTGAGRLASCLADAAGRGADPTRVLKAAYQYDDLAAVTSPALVLASRIEDLPRFLGIPGQEASDRPLPWLAAPSVGHGEWDTYLRQRAQLIANRVAELGSLPAAYREQYRLTHLPADDLGDLPPEGTTRRRAFEIAQRKLPARSLSPAISQPDPARLRSSDLEHERARYLNSQSSNQRNGPRLTF